MSGPEGSGSREHIWHGAPVPINLAVHYLGCAQRVPGGTALPGLVGPHVEALAHAVETLTVVAYDPPAEAPSMEEYTDYVARPPRDNIRFVSLGPKGDWRTYRERRRRVAEIVSEASSEWDVLLLRLPNRRAGLVADPSRCRRLISMVGGHLPSVAPSVGLPLKRKLVTIAAATLVDIQMRRLIRESGLRIVNSEELLRRYHDISDLTLLRSSNRSDRFSFLPDDRMTSDPVRFLIVGRITEEKGVFEALEAFASLRNGSVPTAELAVVGTGAAIDVMGARATALGVADQVHFHGWVPPDERLFDLFRASDVLLMPSWAESFPRTVWEALAHGVLVVCTRVGGLSAAFTDGREVSFVPLRDAEGIANAVTALKDDPAKRHRMIRSGYERARESSLEVVVERLFEHVIRRWPEVVDEADGTIQ